MDALYVTVVVIVAAANLSVAVLALSRSAWMLDNMAKVNVPPSWVVPLGSLKAAGAIGLIVGIWLPPVGVAAAVGLVLYFVGAVITHLRAHADAVSNLYPGAFLVLASGALALQLERVS